MPPVPASRARAPRPRRAAVAITTVLAVLAGLPGPALSQDSSASPPSGQPLTVYSGRSEDLVAPLLEQFGAETGIPVAARYGDSAELAALLLEEGERSPADIFFAQDAGALGAVSAAGLLTALPQAALERVPDAYRDPAGTWLGTSGRARVAAYSTERVGSAGMPESILAFTDPAWKGRIGWAPTNASFQAFVTAMRVTRGEDASRAWLEGILANEPVTYDGNSAAVEGVAAGEVDVAFVNHYYLMRLLEENGEAYPVANHFFAEGDIGALVNVAGAGILGTSDQPEEAARFIDYLVSDEAQAWFAKETFEYPLVEGIPSDPRLPGLESIVTPDIDLGALADLQGTVTLLRDVGALD